MASFKFVKEKVEKLIVDMRVTLFSFFFFFFLIFFKIFYFNIFYTWSFYTI